MSSRARRTVLLVLLAAVATACAVETAPVYRKDDMDYGVTRGLFRSRWWNYYERGCSYADGEYWAEAEADFRSALKQDARDRRRARTYGVLNFIDYFPHRELGVSHFHQGRYPEAIRALETSIAQTPSAKAYYFLDRARREWLLQEGLDTHPPELVLTAPVPGEVTRAFQVRVCGVTRDDFFVSRVSVGGADLPMDVSMAEVSFCMDVPVDRGENRIPVTAEDLLGRVVEEVVTVQVDREGPQLGIRDIRLHEETERSLVLVLDGIVDDEYAVRRLAFNGVDVPIPAGMERSFAFSRRLTLARGESRITFLAEDEAGNRNEGVIELEIPGAAGGRIAGGPRLLPREPFAGPLRAEPLPPARSAPTDLPVFTATRPESSAADIHFPLAGMRSGTLVAMAPPAASGLARDTGGPALVRGASPPGPQRAEPVPPPEFAPLVAARNVIPWRVSPEATPPAGTAQQGLLIRFKDLEPTQRSYTDTLYLEGHVQGDAPVSQLTLNGEPLLMRPARSLFFGVFRKLDPGENELVFAAEDDRGGRVEERVLIEYVVPRAWRLESRLKVFVIPFRHVRCEEALGEYVSQHFLFSLVSQGRFHVVNREELDRVLLEQKLAATEAIDPRTAVRLGRIAQADEALVGTVYEGTRSLEIFAQMVDTETGQVLLEKDVFHEDKSPERVRDITRGLAMKFEHALPLVHGNVLSVDGPRLTSDLGADRNLRPGTRLIVFREKAEVVPPGRSGRGH